MPAPKKRFHMTSDVLCLRPEEDFLRVGVVPPAGLAIAYRALDDADVPELIRNVRALVIPAVGPPLDAALFEASKVELVQVTGAGIDRLDQPALKRLDIAIANVSGGSNGAVAEYVLSAALALMRRLVWADHEIRAGNYADFRSRMVNDRLSGLDGATVGVIGLGTIGGAVAKAFHGMGARIIYHDPAPLDPDAAAAMGAEAHVLPRLLETADVVTLHVPLVAATEGLIGDAELRLMKPDAVLINAARGGVVDEAALAAALGDGRLAGAAVDVYVNEPPDASNPLLALTGEAARRVLFTPHIAGVSRQAWARLFRVAWDNVERVLSQR